MADLAVYLVVRDDVGPLQNDVLSVDWGDEQGEGEDDAEQHRGSPLFPVMGRRLNLLLLAQKVKRSWYNPLDMKRLVLLSLACFLLILPGCGVFEIEQVVREQGGESVVEEGMEVPASWETYVNIKYGYEVSYPAEAILYREVAQVGEQSYILTPDEDADVIRITDANASELVDSEVNVLTIMVVEARSAHEWVTLNLDAYYPEGVGGQTIGEFAGESSIVIRGTGEDDSPDKLVVFQYGEKVFVISHQRESITFERVLDTLRF